MLTTCSKQKDKSLSAHMHEH